MLHKGRASSFSMDFTMHAHRDKLGFDGHFILLHLGYSTYPIQIVVSTGVGNDTKCEISPKGRRQSHPGHEKVTKTRVELISH